MSGGALAVIPARGGSKGIPGKNLALLGGRPLISWTIDAGQAAEKVGRVVVTSDDAAILGVAAAAGCETIERPAELARDDTPTAPVLAHALKSLDEVPATVVLLQPTSPLRTAADIDSALALVDESGADAAISVVEPLEDPRKCMVLGDDGLLHGLVDDETPFLPRQALPRALKPNGAIYVVRTAGFLASRSFLPPRTVPYEMPPERSLDIDVEEDLRRAEMLLGYS